MRWLRAAGAFSVLLLLLGGIPTVLAGTIGNPTDSWPDLLAGDVSDAVLIDLLAAVAWLALAQFAVATTVELVSGLRRTPMPRRIPGVLASQQQLARMLVTALLISPAVATVVLHTTPLARADTQPTQLVGSTATPAVGVTHSTPPPTVLDGRQALGKHARTGRAQPHQTSVRVGAQPIDLSEKASASVYVVPAGDGPATYWDLAEARLGSGERWQEIWHLNEGRRQADGTVMTSARLLLPGWTVLLPDPHHTEPATGTASSRTADSSDTRDPDMNEGEVTVRPGDTLSQIAADHGEEGWHRTWQANADRIEPDGRRFTNPDLILPGWKITLPEAANPATSAPTNTRAQSPTPSVVPAPAQPTVAPPIARPAPKSDTTAAAASPAAATAAAPAAEPDDAGTRADSDAEHTESSPVTSALASTVAFGGGGALLAGLTFTALRRHRRRQFRDRTLGRTIATTPPELAPIEKAMLASATGSGTADVTWLDEALRSLVQTLASGPDGQLPDIVAVRMIHDGLELILSTPGPDAPAPWHVNQDGLRWNLRRVDPLPYDPADRVFHFAPYPTLVTIGSSPSGEHWLLDLERIGALTLTGDATRCADLGRFLAAELAHNCWSEQLQVTLVGFGEPLRGLNPSRVQHALGRRDVTEAITAMQTARRENSAVTAQASRDVLTGRLRNINGDGWTPHVLLIANQDEADTRSLERLRDALRTQPSRTAVALVLVGDHTDRQGAAEAPNDDIGWQLRVDADGTVTIPELGVQLRAQQLPEGEAADLVALLALAADSTDQPAPGSRGTQPWDAYADATGAPLPNLTNPRPPSDPPPQDNVVDLTDTTALRVEAVNTVLPMSSCTYLERSATTAADLDALAPLLSEDARAKVRNADPDLDKDLADWHDPDRRRPKLRLLGPVTLTAWGQPPSKRPAFYTEVVAYLASRPHGATLEQFAAALWPADPDIVSKTTPRQATSVARAWLGANPRTGHPYLPEASRGTAGVGVYRVQDLLVDAELFRRLRLRGVASGAVGIADLEAALDLVTGIPLDQRRPDGYGWLLDLPIESEYLGMIVDVAHLVATHHLATHHLAAGAPDRAATAANTALRAGAGDDVALLDLMAASDAAGNHAEADRYVRRILANHDAEVEEDLPTRTYEVLRRRQWLPN